MSNGTQIRIATAGDADSVRSVVRQSGLFSSPDEIEFIDDLVAIHIEQPQPNHRWLVACDETGAVTAAAYVAPDGAHGDVGEDGERSAPAPAPCDLHTFNLYFLGVLPASRRRGFGAGLITQAEDTARSWGGTVLKIETSNSEDQAPARALYGDYLGYTEAEVIPDAYGDGVSKVIFLKSL
eukprot:m.304804 g.304804  ORF g.304804 m.304804 type:complete len:181 (-) comp17312_c0_seq1:142-684(-)